MNGIINETSHNGVYYQKTFSSLQIETTTVTTVDTETDVKSIKQMKIDLDETEEKVLKRLEVENEKICSEEILKNENVQSSMVIQQIEYKHEEDIIKQNNSENLKIAENINSDNCQSEINKEKLIEEKEKPNNDEAMDN